MFHGACASRVYKRETFLRHKFLPKAAALFDPEHGGGEGAWEGAAGAAALLLRAAHPSSAYCAQNMPPPWGGLVISGMKVLNLVCDFQMSSKVADQCYCTILYNILYIQYKYRDQDPAFNLFGSGFSSVTLKGQSNEIFDP